MGVDTTEELKEEFTCYGVENVDTDFLNSVADLIKLRRLAVEDVVQAVIAISNNEFQGQYTKAVLQSYISSTEKKLPNNKKDQTTPKRPSKPINTENDSNILAAYGVNPTTPLQTKRQQTTPETSSNKRHSNLDRTPTQQILSPDIKQLSSRRLCGLTPSSPKYAQRSNKLEIVSSYGLSGNISFKSKELDPHLDFSSSEGDVNSYRYMFQKLHDRAHVLDRRIERLTAIIKDAKLIECEELTSVTQRSSSDIYVSGMICCDSEGRLNTESVLLQGDMGTSNGRAVQVNIADVSNYSLFPGQVVVMKGQNAEGNLFKATQVVSPQPPPTSLISSSSGFSVIVACGPFTPDDANDFMPLTDLLDEVNKTHPDVLILMGPFLDPNNKILTKSPDSYDQIFANIQEKISKALDPRITVVIAANHTDMHHEPVYPTPAYEPHFQNIKFVRDPCIITINEVVVGLSTADILFAMASNEVSWNADTKDRMLRLSQHLLAQRAFFPMYPSVEDVNLDLELNEKLASIETSPHIMILASDLPQFLKMGDRTVFVNPGKLCKRNVGGTFLRMVIEPITGSSTVIDKFKAEIIRI